MDLVVVLEAYHSLEALKKLTYELTTFCVPLLNKTGVYPCLDFGISVGLDKDEVITFQ